MNPSREMFWVLKLLKHKIQVQEEKLEPFTSEKGQKHLALVYSQDLLLGSVSHTDIPSTYFHRHQCS